MKKITMFIPVLLLLCNCSADRDLLNSEPTRWLGPNADGHYPDTGLLKLWPEDGPEIIWTFDSLGIGFSSAVIQGDSLFCTVMVDSTGFLYKLNLEGDLVYRVPYGPEWNGSYRGTRGSPTVVGEKIYLVSGKGKLLCFNNEDGEILWSRDYFAEFGGKNILWGIAETPVVDGDIIYATPGGKVHNVVALDRHTGELIWACRGKGGLSAYCTPLLIEHNGRKLLVTYTAEYLLGIERVSGDLLWSVDVRNEYSCHFTTPLYHNGEIYYATSLDKGGGKLRLNADGSSVEVVWKNQECDYRGSSILVDGYVYEAYQYYKRLKWRCVNWDTGEEQFISGDLECGASIYADGMLYLYSLKGELALVEPNPASFTVVSQTKVNHGSGMYMTFPMIHEGVLYARHGNAMIAYELKMKS